MTRASDHVKSFEKNDSDCASNITVIVVGLKYKLTAAGPEGDVNAERFPFPLPLARPESNQAK